MSKMQKLNNHLLNLSKIMSKHITLDEFIKLCKIESRGHHLCEEQCNGEVSESEYKRRMKKLEKEIREIFNLWTKDVLKINTDPRGNFLKVSNNFLYEHKFEIDRDWGGYGIICPDELNKFIREE